MNEPNFSRNLSDKVAGLLHSVQESSSQESKAEALRNANSIILNMNDIEREEAALFLMKEVVVLGSPLQRALDESLNSCGAVVILSACSHIFLEASADKSTIGMEFLPHALQTGLRGIRRLLLTPPQRKDDVWIDQLRPRAKESIVLTRASLDSFISLAIRIPIQIANACHGQRIVLPAWAVRSRYLSKFVECSLKMNQFSHSEDDISLLYVQILFQKLIQSGSSDEVATGIHGYYQQSISHVESGVKAMFQDQMEQIMTSLTSSLGGTTRVLQSILQHSVSVLNYPNTAAIDSTATSKKEVLAYLDLTCLPVLESSRDLQDTWTHFVILSPPSVVSDASLDKTTCHVVAHLLKLCQSTNDKDDDSDVDETMLSSDHVLRRQLLLVGKRWADKLFVQRTGLKLQRHVCNFILSGLSLLESDRENVTSPIIEPLLRGVVFRLESGNTDIREHGMRVAETVGARLGQDIHFDELENECKEEEPVEPQQQADASIPSKKHEKKVRHKPCRRPKIRKNVDPDEEYVSDESSDNSYSATSIEGSAVSEDDSLWEDELVPYDLEDNEEDLRETPRPYFLKECLELFRTKEDNEKAFSRLQTALQEVTNLVRARPADLPDLAVPLVKELLRIQDSFSMNDFTVMKQSGLLAVTVEEPLSVGAFIISHLFKGDVAFITRFEILHTVEQAARELCGAKELEDATTGAEMPTTKLSITAHMSHATNRAKTRRWRSDRRETRTVVNRFGRIAPLWFYALVGGFVERKDDSKLWGGANGAHLLTSFLVTLTIIVESSGLAPGTDLLARDLIDFALSFRTAEVAEIRGAILVAVAESLPLLQYDSLLAILSVGKGDCLAEFLRRTALQDSDTTCRELASTLAQTVSELAHGTLTATSS